MSHRVIAGTAKGRRLKLVPGDTTRPIMDRAKEALFSIIGRNIIQSRFLDLFAGTGSVGIEALSRGADYVLFVERGGPAMKTVKQNLELTGLTDKAMLRRTDALVFLKQRPASEPFDFIYIAPPQYKGLWLEVLQLLDAHPGWIAEQTSVIVQIDPSEFEPVEFKHLVIYDERRYGKTKLLFYSGRVEEDETNA